MNKKSIILPIATLIMIAISIVVMLLPNNTKADPYVFAFFAGLALFLLGLFIYKKDNSEFVNKPGYIVVVILGLLAIPFGILSLISSFWS